MARHRHRRIEEPLIAVPKWKRVGRAKNPGVRHERHVIARRFAHEHITVGGRDETVRRDYTFHATKGYRSARA
jgi:hypothetical protein